MPVVMYTGSDLEREALGAGADAFVSKDRGATSWSKQSCD